MDSFQEQSMQLEVAEATPPPLTCWGRTLGLCPVQSRTKDSWVQLARVGAVVLLVVALVGLMGLIIEVLAMRLFSDYVSIGFAVLDLAVGTFGIYSCSPPTNLKLRIYLFLLVIRALLQTVWTVAWGLQTGSGSLLDLLALMICDSDKANQCITTTKRILSALYISLGMVIALCGWFPCFRCAYHARKQLDTDNYNTLVDGGATGD
jgi:hypothetical protein